MKNGLIMFGFVIVGHMMACTAIWWYWVLFGHGSCQ